MEGGEQVVLMTRINKWCFFSRSGEGRRLRVFPVTTDRGSDRGRKREWPERVMREVKRREKAEKVE